MRLVYSLLWFSALPLVVLRLLWRSRRQPTYLKHVAERFGYYPSPPERSTIWVHAVSVGETRAAEPLIRALLARWPQYSVVLTHMTPTGRATSAALFIDEPRVRTVYLPYDLAFLSRRFLRRFRPALGIIMETELWPNLLAVCRDARVPVVLANARLSERSARRYARLPALTRATLDTLAAVGCQTEADAERLAALGAPHITVTGNIKFDIAPPPAQLALGAHFHALIGRRPVIVAASTRENEEAPMVDAFLRQAPAEALLVVVPRHPQRFAEVANLIAARGASLQRRSDGQAVAADTRIWLGDSMGEMFAYYAAADVALIGGSWQPFGGQNPIEACAVGTPVILGPHTFNFLKVAEQAIDDGAALRAEDAEEGIAAALELIGTAARRTEMAQAARAFAAAHRGATEHTMALVEPLIEA